MKTDYKALASTWIVIFISLFSLNVHADRPSYNFVSIEYANRNIDDVIVDPFGMGSTEEDISFDGFALAGSIEINDKWFAELRYSKLEGEQVARTLFTSSANSFSPAPSGATTGSVESKIDSEAMLASSSIGYQIRQSPNSSIFIAAGFARVEVEITEHTETIFRDATGNIVPPDPNTWQPFSQSASASDSGALISAGYRANLGNRVQFGIRIDNVFLDDSTISISGELLYRFAETFALQIASEVAEDEIQFSAGLRYIF